MKKRQNIKNPSEIKKIKVGGGKRKQRATCDPALCPISWAMVMIETIDGSVAPKF